MQKLTGDFWRTRLLTVKKSLEKNNFEVHVVEDGAECRKLVLDEILPALAPRSVAWANSQTFKQVGLYEIFVNHPDYETVDITDHHLSKEESLARRRRTLQADLLFMGANAITAAGQLVNLDGTGNRVAALTFGPKAVVVLAGRNKIVSDVEAARQRIKTYAAPLNALRLSRNTPCVKTGICADCSSPERICNTWTISEKSNPQGRIRIVLINDDLGF